MKAKEILWQCPVCYHVMTEEQSKSYRGCPSGMHVAQHVPVTALFIPLKAEFYDAFARGEKDTEYRVYGPRWNERTCPVGRPVVLSRGYGEQSRMRGTVASFTTMSNPAQTLPGFAKCYGSDNQSVAACIQIKLEK